MKSLLLFTFIFVSFLGFSQKDMSVDLIGSFDYTNIASGIGNNSGLSTFTENGLYTNRFGMNFNFRIYENIIFKTGLRYANLGTETYQGDLRWPSEFGPNGFEPDPELPRYISSKTKHRFIEIPFVVRYEINQNRFSPYLEVGISPHLYSNTKIISETDLSSSSTVLDYSQNNFDLKKMQFSAVFGFGANYRVTESSQLFAQPTLRYNLTGISNFPVSDRFYSVGLEFGYRFLFASYFDKVKA